MTITTPKPRDRPALPAPAPERYTGGDVPRLEGLAKATGTAQYTFDLTRPNMAFGVLVGATIGRGSVVQVDHAAIATRPGVLLVLSATAPPTSPTVGADAPPILWFNRTIDYDGQPVAYVVAETLATAEDAARALPISYVEEPVVATLRDALADDAPQLRAEGNISELEDGAFGNTLGAANYRRGDVTAGLAASAASVTAIYAIAPEVHTPWETMVTLAEWADDHAIIHESTQAPHDVQEYVAQHLGVTTDQVQVIAEYVGGGFGAKLESPISCALTAYAARHLGRPVKSALSRAMLFRMNKHRQASEHHVRIGAQVDGSLAAIDHLCTIAAAIHDDFYDLGASTARYLYRCPNVLSQHRLVRVAVNLGTYMRAPAAFQSQFALETAMDELADQLGMDPVALRLHNLVTTHPISGKDYSSTTLAECLTRGAARIGWERRMAAGAEVSGPVRRGLGMAIAHWPTYRGSSRTGISIDDAGQVTVSTSSVDIGTGQYTILGQVAADALGATLADVVVRLGDTRLPRGILAGGSMGAAATSNATHLAALAARAALVQAALAIPNGPFQGLAAADLLTTHSQVMAKADASRAISFAAIARHAGGKIAVEETYKPEKSRLEMADYGAHFAEVTVDIETGEIRVPRYVAVHDSGRVLNAQTFRSQVQGSVIWGLSAALMEALEVDRQRGRVLNAGLAGYHIPTALDIGELDISWLDDPDLAANPLGVKGVGEVGITGVAPAIGNAIFNATGVRLRSIPFTPRKMLEALTATTISA